MLTNALLAILAICLYLAFSKLKKAEIIPQDASMEMKDNSSLYTKDLSKLLIYCDFLLSFPLTSKNTNQMLELLTEIAYYSSMQARAEVARLTLISDIIFIGGTVFTVVLTKFNLAAIVCAIVIFLVIKRDYVIKRLKKQRVSYLEDLLMTFRSIETIYGEDQDLDKALDKCMTTEKTKLYIDNIIYMIKNSGDRNALNLFNQNNRHNISVRFTTLCFHTKNEGRTKDRSTKRWNFLVDLEAIIRTLDRQVYRSDREIKKFSAAEKTPLVSVLVMFAVPYAFTINSPGMKYYYNTPSGYIFFVASLIVCLGGYVYIANINNHNSINRDTSFLEISYFSNNIRNRIWSFRLGDKRKNEYQSKLEKSLSHMTPEMLLFRKTYYAIGSFIVAVCFSISFVYAQKVMLQDYYMDLSSQELTMVSREYPNFSEINKPYFLPNEEGVYVVPTEDELTALYSTYGYYLEPEYAQAFINQITINQEALSAVTYQWWYLLLCFPVGVGAFFLPDYALKRRRKQVEIVSLEELLTFYSILSISKSSGWKVYDYFSYLADNTKLYPTLLYRNYFNSFNHPELVMKSVYTIKHKRYRNLIERIGSTHQIVKPIDAFESYRIDCSVLEGDYNVAELEKLEDNLVRLRATMLTSFVVVLILRVGIPLFRYVFDMIGSAGLL